MSEVASFRLIQQRDIEKFLKMILGSNIVESDKNLVDSTEGCANNVRRDFIA